VKKWTSILIACLALALVAGCGGSDKKSSNNGSSGTTASDTTAASKTKPPATAGKVVAVDIKNIKFNPHDITVAKGGTIQWTNSDSFPHNVTKTGGPGAAFKSGNIDGGATYEQKFDTAGTIDYVCTIHSGQSGKIIVK
jgi:plastocyanin